MLEAGYFAATLRGRMDSPDAQFRTLARAADTIIPEDEFRDRLAEGRPLRVKLGLDPTAPSVTLGWAVVLRKLRQFQELGHTAVLIVGDFTAQVGDPSGKSETRRRLSESEVKGYAEQVLGQFSRVLLPEPLEIRYNSEWLAELTMADVLELTSKTTVAQMLEREDFRNRFDAGQPISTMEFMYPLLQGYDSVAIDADIELGGSDQLWNNMMGRVLMERYGKRGQMVLTMPLLVGTDGVQKMSQSLGNYVGVTDAPEEMFGKIMSVPDTLMPSYFELLTDVDTEVVDDILSGHAGEAKRRLAREIVTTFHDANAATDAEAHFDRLFKRHEAPEDLATHELSADDPVFLPAVLTAAGLTDSNSDARRMIKQGAVKLDGVKVDGEEAQRDDLVGRVLQVGKRRFVRLV